MEDLKSDTIITLTGENGEPVDFDLLLVFDHEGKKYAAMMPLGSIEGVGEDEVVILEVKHHGQEEIFDPIESPVLLSEIFDEFQRLYEEKLDREEAEEE